MRRTTRRGLGAFPVEIGVYPRAFKLRHVNETSETRNES